MKKKRKSTDVKSYIHSSKRLNNPPAGLVSTKTEKQDPPKKYKYDPHIDPSLQWAGKHEKEEFLVDTASLHVHERIDSLKIINNVRKEKKKDDQLSLFDSEENILPLSKAIEFYQHNNNWTNRLITGDSLIVMNSLLQKENMGSKVQLIYIDPPYGIKYGSNFQPFTTKSSVQDGNDNDLSSEPEMIKAFRDTWKLGIHSYLTYMRDRLLLSRELLSESGSCIVQISDENLHLVRNLMDEIFRKENFFSLITFRKAGGLGSKGLQGIGDYLVWYAKDKEKIKYNPIYVKREFGEGTPFVHIEEADGTRRKMTPEEKLNPKHISKECKVFRIMDLVSSGYTPTCTFDFEFEGQLIKAKNKSWRTNKEGMNQLISKNRLFKKSKDIGYVLYYNDYPVQSINNLWNDTQGATSQIYVVQTSTNVVQRCLLMTTDPGDLVLDPTCGSGTTAFVAEKFGRRWITCDTSRIATTLAKQRMLCSIFDYYELAKKEEGIDSGLIYKTVPHVTLGSIANNRTSEYFSLLDIPKIDSSKKRVCGPFTVESTPSPSVTAYENLLDSNNNKGFDESIAREGQTFEHNNLQDELLSTGIIQSKNKRIEFSKLETIGGTHWVHSLGETKETNPKIAAISFGPKHHLLGKIQVARVIEEADRLMPKPNLIVFAAYQFDPEASKEIDNIKFKGVDLIKIQMNTDLLVDDLKSKRKTNESFWLIGQPDIELKKLKNDEFQIKVNGFDYLNPKTSEIESGGIEKIAMWLLDTDYDGQSFFPSQIFFSSNINDWSKLAKTLGTEIDEKKILKYKGTESLPFKLGDQKRAAVKIIDNRAIESIKIIDDF